MLKISLCSVRAFYCFQNFPVLAGCFLGCQLAGPLFVRFAGVEAEQFIWFFRCTLLLPILMILLVIPMKNQKNGLAISVFFCKWP